MTIYTHLYSFIPKFEYKWVKISKGLRDSDGKK